MYSLQRRVIAGGLVWAVAATLLAGFVVTKVFDEITDRQFNEILRARHTQVIVAIGNSQSPKTLGQVLNDPAYDRSYSGKYWQVTGSNGECITSPSLFDAKLPQEPASAVGAKVWEGLGPMGPVRGIREAIVLDDGTKWTVSVASNLSSLAVERAEMERSVTLAFGSIGLLGLVGAALLMPALTRPLKRLGDDVRNRWDSGKGLSPSDYPLEVAPLISDINELIARNREVLDSGRRQAADLAHALKTPSAAMRNHVVSLSRKVDGILPLFEGLDKIDAQISRSLGRMRAATAENAFQVRTDVETSISRMERLFRSLPNSQGKSFEVISRAAKVAVDAQDLEEILGNLLENAFKWSRQNVRLSAEEIDGVVRISIEDDGPGIEPSLLFIVLQEGARLDTSVPGTGLGLSITNDLVKAYGGTLNLKPSKNLGGLCGTVELPIAGPALELDVAQRA